MNEQTKEALKMAIEAMNRIILQVPLHDKDKKHPILDAIQACKEALAEAEKQEKEAQQDAEAWLKQLNNEMKNDDAKLTLDEGRKIMRALEALKEKNYG